MAAGPEVEERGRHAAGLHLCEAQLDGSDRRRLSTADRVAWQDRLQTGRSHIHLLRGAETCAAADRFSGLVWRNEGTRNVSEKADVVRALRAFNGHLRREIRSDGRAARAPVRRRALTRTVPRPDRTLPRRPADPPRHVGPRPAVVTR
ncbi:hypothetical protein ABGB09_09125 [Streptomyces sp. B8F3]|uniref:hypothetical protein n=1 Tax=Streptomyces sp. B8F3 TaxID=3153573 RepID=UPI00325D4766